MTKSSSLSATNLWKALREEVEISAKGEPLMAEFFESHILRRDGFGDALAYILADRLAMDSGDGGLDQKALYVLFKGFCADGSDVVAASKKDLLATMDRDPAVTGARIPLLYFKGYQAIQAYRIAHHLWNEGRKDLAFFVQSRSSRNFQVDIHPAARLGHGILLDHATGLVVGETAVVGNDVSILHGVTLGGTGKQGQDRHPKISDGVLLGAGATILGNIRIGEGSRVAAGSMVLRDVPPHVTVVGVPARVVGKAGGDKESKINYGTIMDQMPATPETQSGTSPALDGARR